MKTIRNILFFATLCLLGCNENFVTLTNKDSLEEIFYSGGTSTAEKMINAAYAPLQKNGFYCRTASQLSQTRSDESRITKNTPKMEEDGVAACTYTNNANGLLGEMIWSEAYNGILHANIAIDRINKSKNVTADKASQFLGEAYFLRALYYFHLTMYFGEIIPKKIIIGEVESNTFIENEVWDLMISDLKLSQQYFASIKFDNSKSINNDKGRANLGAATGLLGKVYLYYAQMKNANSTSMINLAKDEFLKIVGQKVGVYELEDNYMDNFKNTKEYNKESIFEIGFEDIGVKVYGEIDSDNAGAAESNKIAKNSTMCDAVGEMWWNEAPTARMLNEYEVNNGQVDYRSYYTIWQPGGAYFDDCKIVDKAVKDTIVKYEGAFRDSTNKDTEWGKEYNDYKFYGWRKYGFDYNFWVKDNIDVTNKVGSNINYRYMRYADVLLMLAECEFYTGGDPKPYIKLVRDRANHIVPDINQLTWGNANLPYLTKVGTLPDVDNSKYAGNMEAAIQHERMVELACESSRYFDIIRWSSAGLLLDLRKPGFPKANLKEVIIDPGFSGNFLMPIPQTELSINPNAKPNSAN